MKPTRRLRESDLPKKNLKKIGCRLYMTLFDSSANAIHTLNCTMAKSFYPSRLIIKRISGSLNEIPAVAIRPVDKHGMLHPFEIFYNAHEDESVFLQGVRERYHTRYFLSSGTRSINCYVQSTGGISFDYDKVTYKTKNDVNFARKFKL